MTDRMFMAKIIAQGRLACNRAFRKFCYVLRRECPKGILNECPVPRAATSAGKGNHGRKADRLSLDVK